MDNGEVLLPVRITGTGKGLPRRCVSTEEVARLCGVDPQEALQRTGVVQRYWVSAGETALDLGAAAAVEALRSAGSEIDDVDLIINASGTPVQPLPDGASLLAGRLGLVGANAFSVHTTCLSFLTGLVQASVMISAGLARRALVVSMEVGSIALNYNQPESALLIGDGAAAVVVEPAEHPGQGIVSTRFECHPDGGEFAQIRGGGSAIPYGSTDDENVFMFDMKGLPVVLYCVRRMPGFLERLRPGLSKKSRDLDYVVTHQPSKVGMLVFSRFIDEDLLQGSLDRYGNVIAASIPLTLADTGIKEGATIGLLGAGAGVSLGGVLLQA